MTFQHTASLRTLIRERPSMQATARRRYSRSEEGIPSGTYARLVSEESRCVLRPDPDAIMRVNGDTASVYQRARIVVQSPQEKTREVSVEATGQISVSQQEPRASKGSKTQDTNMFESTK